MNPFNPPGAIPLGAPQPMTLGDTVEAIVEDALARDGDFLSIEDGEGGITLEEIKGASRKEETPENWFRNIADELDDMALGTIASEIIEGVQSDERSRQQWMSDRVQIINMLGLKLDEPKTSVTGGAGESLSMSSVQSPLMLESTLLFQANAGAELLPADGPVQVAVESGGDTTSDEDAQTLEDILNYYLTVVASEYYPDTTRMLFGVGYGGCGFKKVYRCPVRRRPVSESVDPSDLIVNNTATDLKNAVRITHHLEMPHSTLRRMQLVGAYRDVEIGEESYTTTNEVKEAKAEQQGVAAQPDRPKDAPHQLYETYCELDIPGFEDKEKGKPTGLMLPWKVTVHVESQQVLEVRRNWEQNDPQKMARQVFVKFPFVEGMGFYGIGLGHILGNTQRALTAMERLGIDNAMFANFPGFLIAKESTRQNTNEIRVPPGGGAPVDVGSRKIGDAVMPLPYKDLSPAFIGMMQSVQEGGQRLGGSAQIQVGEGKQDAPVGTTLALIEQATKTMSAVHKNLHAAQAREFELLVDLFRADPGALFAGRKGSIEAWDEKRIMQALERSDIAPKADPNTPSNMHRMMKAQALLQLARGSQNIDQREAEEYALRILGFNDIEKLMPPRDPSAQPQINPTDQAALMVGQARVMDAQTKAKKAEADAILEARKMQVDANIKQQEIDGRKDVAAINAQRPAPLRSI